MPSPIPISSPAWKRGFTLVETLVVLAILGVLAAFSVPAVTSVMSSYNVNSAGQSVLGQLTLARQEALANNCQVEVRFYQIPNAKGTRVYRAMQTFREDSDGVNGPKITPIGKPYILPQGIWVVHASSQTAASTLFTIATSGARISEADAAHPLPPPYGASPYLFFRFRPNGRTDLTNSSLITIAAESAPIAANNLPSNFITLQIDPVNGSVRAYQP